METRFTFFGKGNDMANFEETRDNFTDIEATIIEADNRDETHWWTWPIPVADCAELDFGNSLM